MSKITKKQFLELLEANGNDLEALVNIIAYEDINSTKLAAAWSWYLNYQKACKDYEKSVFLELGIKKPLVKDDYFKKALESMKETVKKIKDRSKNKDWPSGSPLID